MNDGWELYVYFNGRLIYKRWLKHRYSMTMHDGEGLTQFARWQQERLKEEVSEII